MANGSFGVGEAGEFIDYMDALGTVDESLEQTGDVGVGLDDIGAYLNTDAETDPIESGLDSSISPGIQGFPTGDFFRNTPSPGMRETGGIGPLRGDTDWQATDGPGFSPSLGRGIADLLSDTAGGEVWGILRAD